MKLGEHCATHPAHNDSIRSKKNRHKDEHRPSSKVPVKNEISVSSKQMAHSGRKREESRQMMETDVGRATLLATAIQDTLHREVKRDDAIVKKLELEPMSLDDMVYLAEKMMRYRSRLQKQKSKDLAAGRYNDNCNLKVTLGYHYTSITHMESIRYRGLLSHPERVAKGVKVSKASAAYFGDGIYTANNPFCFQKYGSVGLICAIVPGITRRITPANDVPKKGVNTVVGNKSKLQLPCFEETVLKASAQCLPLMRFSRSAVSSPTTTSSKSYLQLEHDDLLWDIHKKLQNVIDKFFNVDVSTPTTFFYRHTHPSLGNSRVDWPRTASIAQVITQPQQVHYQHQKVKSSWARHQPPPPRQHGRPLPDQRAFLDPPLLPPGQAQARRIDELQNQPGAQQRRALNIPTHVVSHSTQSSSPFQTPALNNHSTEKQDHRQRNPLHIREQNLTSQGGDQNSDRLREIMFVEMQQQMIIQVKQKMHQEMMEQQLLQRQLHVCWSNSTADLRQYPHQQEQPCFSIGTHTKELRQKRRRPLQKRQTGR